MHANINMYSSRKNCCLVGSCYVWSIGRLCYVQYKVWSVVLHFGLCKLLSIKYLCTGGGHFGRDKTIEKVCSRYYWSSVQIDIRSYVASCECCQKCNLKLQKQPSKLHPIVVKPEVWQRIGIDILGPLRTSKSGNKYIVTCSDYFSKWIEAKALPDKTAHSIAKFLLSLICRFGCFQICHTDQGREFVNQLNGKLFELAGVKHRISSAYHPQTNGLDEKANQTISRTLLKYVNDEQDDWDEYLDSILFAYRTSKHASTQYSPFFLMYGRDAILPVELKVCMQVKFKMLYMHTIHTHTDIKTFILTCISIVVACTQISEATWQTCTDRVEVNGNVSLNMVLLNFFVTLAGIKNNSRKLYLNNSDMNKLTRFWHPWIG